MLRTPDPAWIKRSYAKRGDGRSCLSVEPKPDFATLVPAKELNDVAKMTPRRPAKPILGRIALDEQASNGTAVFGVTDSANTQTHRVNPVDGHFPW